MSEKRYTNDEIAAAAGLTIRTVRHYDNIGLLPSSGRTEGGRRYYVQDDLIRIEQIVFYSRSTSRWSRSRSSSCSSQARTSCWRGAHGRRSWPWGAFDMRTYGASASWQGGRCHGFHDRPPIALSEPREKITLRTVGFWACNLPIAQRRPCASAKPPSARTNARGLNAWMTWLVGILT